MAFNISYVVQAVDKFSPIAKRVARSVDNVNNKFTGLSTKMASTSSSMRKVGERTRGLGNKFVALGAKISVSRDSMRKFGSSAKKFGRDMTLFASTSISFMGFSMVKAASDADEAASKFNTVFKSISNDANSVAKNLANSFGLARTEAKELLGDTGDLLTGFGFAEKTSLDLSRQVNELAVDLASFTNFSGGATGASKALTKALLGERESIKSLGISILEEDVKRRVQILRAKGMTFETNRQAKAFATLQLAQEQSKNAIGDFARTSKGLANQARILNARFRDFKESFGRIMIPLANKLVGVLQRMLVWFDSLSSSTKKWALIIAGLVAVVGPIIILLGMMAAAMAAIGVVGGIVIAVILAIGVVVGGAIALFKKFGSTVKFFFLGIVQVVSDVVSKIGNAISNFAVKVFDIFSGIASVIVSPFVLAFDTISSIIGKAGAAAKKIASFFGFGDGIDVNVNQGGSSLARSGAPAQSGIASGGPQGVQSEFNGTLNINGAPQGSSFVSSTQNMGLSVGMNMAGAN